MAPNQANDGSASFGGRVPANVKTAFSDWAREIDYERRAQNIGESHVYRQALYEFMLNNWADAPEEVREQVDREWLKTQVDGGVGIEL